MKILGIESSCDETAAAVVEDGRLVLSNIVASQIDIHAKYGGVVPEVAARSHIEVILPVIHQALDQAKCSWNDIDGIAVTSGPGLLGSLLIGTLSARYLAILHDKPLYSVNHVVAHTFANYLGDNPEKLPQKLSFPLVSLSVSGGHSHLMLFESPLSYKLLGATRDDAAGEAFDKVAKMMGLPYPGGPSIGIAAKLGDEYKYQLPRANLGTSYDFSFSGLKTAVLRILQAEVGGDFRTPSYELADKLTDQQKYDMAASFQRTICETLSRNLLRAKQEYKPRSLVIAGGVAANQRLRDEVSKTVSSSMVYAPMQYCTDNGAMIASLGYFMATEGNRTDPYSLITSSSVTF